MMRWRKRRAGSSAVGTSSHSPIAGRASRLVWSAVIAVLLYAAWGAGRPYLDHFGLQDKMLDVCRLPRATNPDERVLDRLMKEVREQQLEPYIGRGSFQVTTTDVRRRITLEYDREIRLLPGLTRKVHFRAEQNQLLPKTAPSRSDDLRFDGP
jgi:hypothetical protein